MWPLMVWYCRNASNQPGNIKHLSFGAHSRWRRVLSLRRHGALGGQRTPV